MSTTTTHIDEHVPVLIVGGSVVGLSTALFLAKHGIPSLLVERHATTSIHTRAGSFNTRTMELYRQVGLETDIFQHETPPAQAGEMGLRMENLVGKVLDRNEMIINQQYQQADPFTSPTRRSMIGQDKLEPLLRAHAQAAGSDIRFGTEMITFTADETGITAQLQERASGKTYHVRAQYLVAADGNSSPIRQRLGITTEGYGQLGDWISILFRTDLDSVLSGRRISLCFINNPTVEGIMGQAEDCWGLFARINPWKHEVVDQPSPEHILELVRAAIGIPDQPVEIISTLYWKLTSQVARRYQQGRVFLVGDAAHTMTTMGAFGANTGIADAHNLAWKLASVIKGHAGTDLLTTYEAERQPAAYLAVGVSLGLYAYRMPKHEQSAAIARSAAEMIAHVRRHPDAPQPTGFSVVQGYRYRSAAIIPGEGDDDDVLYENAPSGRPGTRAPHIQLECAGQRSSILDLYGHNFVLLTGPDDHSWSKAATSIESTLGIKLASYHIGQNEGANSYRDSEHDFLTTYGISRDGAVLVRPDGFIAWRSQQAVENPATTLERVLGRILSR